MNVVATYWFRPKRYGYGATPVTWQGWAVTLAVAGIAVAATVRLKPHAVEWPAIWAAIVVSDVLALVALLVVTRRKTEGEWRWRWGNDQPNR